MNINMTAEQQRIHDALVKGFVDRGMLIRAGFESLRQSVIAPDAPKVQVDEMRMAFMAGAQHLYGSLLALLDPGEEATERDIKRMATIGAELENYAKELALRLTPAAGARQ